MYMYHATDTSEDSLYKDPFFPILSSASLLADQTQTLMIYVKAYLRRD